MSSEILFTIEESGTAVLTINRPQARNALNWTTQTQFADYVTAVAKNTAIRVLIITGAGESAFISGGDLKELVDYPSRADAARLKTIMGDALTQLTQLPIPVIAAINGDAFGGGCELLTACDLRIAAPNARFCFAQVRNALTTGWGGTERLVPLIGQSRALELMLSGRIFGADEAIELGFIHQIATGDLLEDARMWAESLVALPKNALAAIKQLVHTAVYQPQKTAVLEETLFLDLWTHPNHAEAVSAFLEKRAPFFDANGGEQ